MTTKNTAARVTPEQARQALAAYPLTADRLVEWESGLINRTFLVTTASAGAGGRETGGRAADNGEFVLQAVNPLFTPAGNADIIADIDHLTGCLRQAGLLAPRLRRARDGRLFTRHRGLVWRLYERIEGETRQTPGTAAAVESAAALLARVHAALSQSDYTPRFSRPGLHDTARHIRHLRANLERHREHPEYAAVLPLAREILERYDILPPLPPAPPRLAHGDPKISNFLYRAGTDSARCLVDYDTFCRMPLALEIGDALRSWCNPKGEDSADGRFDRELALAALRGYAAHSATFIAAAEWRGFIAAAERVGIELAARFCADALAEDYFHWDAKRFPSHSRHSQVRARGQLAAARSLRRQASTLQSELEKIFHARPQAK